MEINTLNDFIEAMPKNLDSIVKKVRFLYLELGRRSFYDTRYKYFMFGEEEQDNRYSNKTFENPNIIICTTLTKQFEELLKLAGVSYEVQKDNYGHPYIEFYDENGQAHKCDITNDLKNIQFGCRTSYFGKETIYREDLKRIDLELGYISNKRSYSDDYWYIVRDIISNSKLDAQHKLEIVLNNLQRFGDISSPR